MSIEKLTHIVEERVLGRYYGKYVGVVTNVDDPRELGRIRARVPEVLGAQEECGWALPAPPFGGGKSYGILFMPQAGDTVWIEFAAGDLGRPIWSGGFWGAPETAGGARDLATTTGNEVPTGDGDAAVNPGDLVLRTRAGHRLIFDDAGEITILANGNGKTEIRLTRDGEVLITADTIKLGANAAESLVLGDAFKSLFNQHTHPTGVGPSGPPSMPMAAQHLSTKTKTE
jgi:uncharacterized protein involved in type VI secretion and phage assembly